MTLFDDTEISSPVVSGPVVRVRMTVAYDGRGFHGFVPNQGVKTVGGALFKSIERVLGHPIQWNVAGRTDTGVHAWGQVVSFDAREEGLDLPALQRAVNKLCGPAVVVREIAPAAPGFDARRSAVSRTYRYTILNRPVPDPFLAATSWHVEIPLDLAAMRLGADPLIGEHDFSSFCRRPRVPAGAAPPSMTRRVLRADWHDLGDGVLRFDITASSFCQQMVRSVVGTLIEVGIGTKRRAGDVAAIVRAADRAAAGELAPPHGLCLWEVRYPD